MKTTTGPATLRLARTLPRMSGRSVHRHASRCLAAVLVALLTLTAAETAKAEKPVDALTSCWRQTTLAGAAQGCDPPEAVVDATYQACVRQEAAWHNALLKAGGIYGLDMGNGIFSRVKTSARTILLKLVVETRAQKGSCR